jgi:hypothetical protein
LQAVKAIAGGVTTLKGQLIKGSGYVVSGGGKVCVNSDIVNDFGVKIIKILKSVKFLSF